MKNALLLTSLILISGIVEAQSKNKPDAAYRVEKEYDKEGTLIRYDSSKVFNNSNSFKTFNFYFKKDSLSKESFLRLYSNAFHLDSLEQSFNFDSMVNSRRLFFYQKKIEFDSLLKQKDLFPEPHKWIENSHFNSTAFKKQLGSIDSVILQYLHRLEKQLKNVEQQERKNSKEGGTPLF